MRERVGLPDVNVLVAAHVPGHIHHEAALAWLETAPAYATCPTTEIGMVRLLSNQAIAGPAGCPTNALAALKTLRAQGEHVFWPDGASLDAPRLGLGGLVGFKQVTDWHLLNLAAQVGGHLVTLDAKIENALRSAEKHLVHTLRP